MMACIQYAGFTVWGRQCRFSIIYCGGMLLKPTLHGMETAKMIECANKTVDIVFKMPVIGNLLGTRLCEIRLKLIYPAMAKDPMVAALSHNDKSQVMNLAAKMILARF